MPRPPSKCGTASGYARHKYLKEPQCLACTAAQAEYDAKRRADPEIRERITLRNRAQHRAEGRLKAMYPNDWRALMAEELAAVSPTTTEGDKHVTPKREE